MITTTGVRRRTMLTTHGTRISTMVIRTTTTRTIQTGSVLFGVLDKPVPCPDKLLFGQGVFMQLELFPVFNKPDCSITLYDLFEAYFNCRSNKRRTDNALAFEVDYENNLIKLLKEINSGLYNPGKSIAFVVIKPVKREIFAANFRDRIVHHLIINKLNPLFEKEFIHDSFACRVGKGTHYGIRRVDHFIRTCSQNYTKDCFILKLDIKAFFMSINRGLLFKN